MDLLLFFFDCAASSGSLSIRIAVATDEPSATLCFFAVGGVVVDTLPWEAGPLPTGLSCELSRMRWERAFSSSLFIKSADDIFSKPSRRSTALLCLSVELEEESSMLTGTGLLSGIRFPSGSILILSVSGDSLERSSRVYLSMYKSYFSITFEQSVMVIYLVR